MKNRLKFSLFLILLSSSLLAQTADLLRGTVSYINSQNVYVKFEKTEGIQVGDTLFITQNGLLKPALVVKSLSSISCLTNPISGISLTVNTPIAAKPHLMQNKAEIVHDKTKASVAINDMAINSATNKETSAYHSKLYGKIAVSSYSNLSDNYKTNHRLRYNFSLNADHLNNSKFSTETYINFTHRLGETIKMSDALKIYSLAVKYDIDKTSNVSVGRRINLQMANIGAVDGVQYEKTHKNLTYGALIGFRPDYYDYGFNPNLMQFGAFVSHNVQKAKGSFQTSVAIFDQMNSFKTDRRFAYIQHTNSLIKNVDLFCSFEIDLYGRVNNKLTTTFDLTSAYLSLRYRPWKQLSMSLSYDARKNIYYYETFKNQIDSILDKETRQGLRFTSLIRPFKYFIIGINAGYRFPIYQKVDTINSSMNANAFMSYSQLPLGLSATINGTYFNSDYTKGTVYGISLSRDFLSGKLNAEVEYRMANYSFSTSPTPLDQNIGELSLGWRIAKKLMLSANIELTMEKDQDGLRNNSTRAFINLTKRF